MADREKVINGLEHCRRGPIGCQQECPYKSDFGCRSQLTADALELLKEQEPVKPNNPFKFKEYDLYMCAECGSWLITKSNYCWNCGRAVKWDVN